MNATLKLLALMADGQARTNDQLEEETGLKPAQIGAILYQMRGRRFMRFSPVRYEITETGLDRVARAQAREKKKAAAEAEKQRRIAARAAAAMKPIGRPRMTEEERRAIAGERRLRARQRRAAARLALKQKVAAERAAERAALEAQKEIEEAAELRFVHTIVEAGAEPDPMIEQAVRLQPALHSVWGAVA